MGLQTFAAQYPTFFIIGLSLFVTLMSTLAHKYLTNQTHLKSKKERQKEIQKELKSCKDPKKMGELNSELLGITGEMFKASMKPLWFTFIPFMIIIFWANTNIAYENIAPNQEFQVTTYFDKNAQGTASIEVPEGLEIIGEATKNISNNQISWLIKGEEGTHNIIVNFAGQIAQKEVVISQELEYGEVTKKYSGSVEKITIDYEKIIYLNLFGWKLGWLGSYILLSIVFSMILRKAMNVH